MKAKSVLTLGKKYLLSFSTQNSYPFLTGVKYVLQDLLHMNCTAHIKAPMGTCMRICMQISVKVQTGWRLIMKAKLLQEEIMTREYCVQGRQSRLSWSLRSLLLIVLPFVGTFFLLLCSYTKSINRSFPRKILTLDIWQLQYNYYLLYR